MPGLWIGNQFSAHDVNFYLENNIKRVVNCTPNVSFIRFPTIRGMRIPVQDSSDSATNMQMAAYLPKAVAFILGEPPSRLNAVLVHCHVGVSRSSTVVAATLRTCCARSMNQALAMVISKRPIAFFNGMIVNFREALTLFDKGLTFPYMPLRAPPVYR
jgi:hypothetical protein